MESSAMLGALAREARRFRSGLPPPPACRCPRWPTTHGRVSEANATLGEEACSERLRVNGVARRAVNHQRSGLQWNVVEHLLHVLRSRQAKAEDAHVLQFAERPSKLGAIRFCVQHGLLWRAVPHGRCAANMLLRESMQVPRQVRPHST